MKKLLTFLFAIISVVTLATEVRIGDVCADWSLKKYNIDPNTVTNIQDLHIIDISVAAKYAKTHPEIVKEIEDRLIIDNRLWIDTPSYEVFPRVGDAFYELIFKDYPELLAYGKTNKVGTNNFPDDVYLRNAGCLRLDFNSIKNRLSRNAPKIIKKWLRSQGKSFVTRKLDDGTEFNPMKESMDQFNVCLNAARFAGMNEWMESHGSDLRVVINTAITDEELAQLKEDILFGEKELSQNIGILVRNMSVDDYNAFIKEYNEGNAK